MIGYNSALKLRAYIILRFLLKTGFFKFQID